MRDVPYYVALLQTPDIIINASVNTIQSYKPTKPDLNRFMRRLWLFDRTKNFSCLVNIDTGLVLSMHCGDRSRPGIQITITPDNTPRTNETEKKRWKNVKTGAPRKTTTCIRNTCVGPVRIRTRNRTVQIPELRKHITANEDYYVGALVHKDKVRYLDTLRQIVVPERT